MFATDFTDCPLAALRYAQGRRGVLLVLDLHEGEARIREELWPNAKAKRLMIWGRFDHLIVAVIPAKDMRQHIRKKGVVASSDAHKAAVLERVIGEWLMARDLRRPASARRPSGRFSSG